MVESEVVKFRAKPDLLADIDGVHAELKLGDKSDTLRYLIVLGIGEHKKTQAWIDAVLGEAEKRRVKVTLQRV